MKTFHVFVWPYSNECASLSCMDYYKGSYKTVDKAMKYAPLGAYCEILETVSDGSLKLSQSAFEQNKQWVWTEQQT